MKKKKIDIHIYLELDDKNKEANTEILLDVNNYIENNSGGEHFVYIHFLAEDKKYYKCKEKVKLVKGELGKLEKKKKIKIETY